MPLVPGARIGQYEIVTPLGAGGIGEVYRARDARLQRDVAIKIGSTRSSVFGAEPALAERDALSREVRLEARGAVAVAA